jgi:hypothetical protein
MSVSMVRREHRVEFSDGYVSAYLPLSGRMWVVTAYKRRGSGFSRAHTCRRTSEEAALETAREMATLWGGPCRSDADGERLEDAEWIRRCRVRILERCDMAEDEAQEAAADACEIYRDESPEQPAEAIAWNYNDPTPWCSHCGAKRRQDCNCGPKAEND